MCHLQLTNPSPLLVSFEDSLSSQIINSFYKVNGKCHFESFHMCQTVICYVLFFYIKAHVKKDASFTVHVSNLASNFHLTELFFVVVLPPPPNPTHTHIFFNPAA